MREISIVIMAVFIFLICVVALNWDSIQYLEKHNIRDKRASVNSRLRSIGQCVIIANESSLINDETSYGKLKKLYSDYNSQLSQDQIDREFRDPFSKGDFRFINKDSRVVIYSIGPDKIDQNNALIYDPTNGINSHGDIIKMIIYK